MFNAFLILYSKIFSSVNYPHFFQYFFSLHCVTYITSWTWLTSNLRASVSHLYRSLQIL